VSNVGRTEAGTLLRLAESSLGLTCYNSLELPESGHRVETANADRSYFNHHPSVLDEAQKITKNYSPVNNNLSSHFNFLYTCVTERKFSTGIIAWDMPLS
jgi:hypothetical protein